MPTKRYNQKKVQALRQHAYRKQSCLCYYCQFPMWEIDEEDYIKSSGLPPHLTQYLRSTAEHLQAQQDNGKDASDNIVAACLWCNRMRHEGRSSCAPDPTSYKNLVSQLVSEGCWHPVVSM